MLHRRDELLHPGAVFNVVPSTICFRMTAASDSDRYRGGKGGRLSAELPAAVPGAGPPPGGPPAAPNADRIISI